ncbi:hypothetical protein DAPPUDRAFT_98670 [Daphnia pulex]|uniref:Uncharacterized protein n=1 Tax=Daphnia pulex TaxID=6669 RepID=E9G5F7_DAPPU|nr:hypothetical protein DAPPUDRAFT_98670 [Daphnia pulex]|eukprot:EFX85638.1 hypothetical protein DAPPUDRAFT_98670 [Daphnia pulex]
MPVYYTSTTTNKVFQSDANGITGCQLNQFCCGCSLRTGTKVVGSLSMLQTDLNHSQLGGVAVLIYSLTVISSLNNNTRHGNYFLLGHSLGNANDSKIPMTSFVTSAVAIVCSIPVLVMAYKNLSPRLLVPWLVVNIVPSLAVIGFFIYLAVFELIIEGLDDIIGIIVIFAGVLSGAIWFYFWLVIYSFYQNRKINDRQPLLDDQQS